MSRGCFARISIFVAIATACALAAAPVKCADQPNPFELSTTDVAILNPDSLQVIGHGHYHVTHLEGADLFEGDNDYLDGEHDSEVQRVERGANASPPILVSYQHSFFAADGAPLSIDRLDAKSGAVSCTVYSEGVPEVRESKMLVPPDTYAGSTQLMLLVGRLRQGARDITMHAFICLPGPRIVAIKVTPPLTTEKWPMYPGNLVKVELVPDLGWLSAIAGPFIPKAYGWFDPGDDFNYVGGLFDRFYRRRHLLMVKTPSAPKLAQNR
ncbi:MAG TPA: hypothetical protein VN867_04550 [Candidatus Binataceae bacterium]|nr:hypothetical protein [Candidatus Binataceae bacterium]